MAVFIGCQGTGEGQAALGAQGVDPADDEAWIDGLDEGEDAALGPSTAPAPSPAPESSTSSATAPAALAGAPSTGSVVGSEAAEAPGDPEGSSASVPRPTSAGEGAAAGQASSDAPATDEQPVEAGALEPGALPPANAVPEAAPATPAAEPPAPAAPLPITLADFAGSYRFVGGQAQRDGVIDAVEDTVQSLSVAFRGIARRRLTSANPIDTKVEIGIAGDSVTTTFQKGFSVTHTLGGPAVQTRGIEGDKLDVKIRMKGTKLVQHLQGKGGARTIVYVLSSDRKRLTIHHKITSPRLPVPVVYRLSYTR